MNESHRMLLATFRFFCALTYTKLFCCLMKCMFFLYAAGYCGADIKALCTEAALIALRRRYPQIYVSCQKLQLDVSSIVLSAQDFYHAMQNIVPASQRAVMSSGHALSPIIRPLLERTFNDILAILHRVFPHAEFSQGDKKEGTFMFSFQSTFFSVAKEKYFLSFFLNDPIHLQAMSRIYIIMHIILMANKMTNYF